MAPIKGKQLADGTVGAAKVDTSIVKADGTNPLTADWAVGGFKITGLGAPIDPGDAATKAFVEAVTQGLDVHGSVRALAVTPLPANIFAGDTLTATSNGVLPAQDGVVLVPGNRLLVTGEASGANNGLYVVTQVGSGGSPYVLTRASDADVSAEVTAGLFVFVEEGTVYADTGWVLVTNNPIVLNSTPLAFSQFAGVQQLLAGAGLVRTGNTFDLVIAPTSGGLTANADELQVNYALTATLAASDAGAANQGTSQLLARGDHKHTVTTDAAVELTDSTNGGGASTALSRADHTHAHGNRGGGALHSTATVSTAGFLSATDKTKLDSLPLGPLPPFGAHMLGGDGGGDGDQGPPGPPGAAGSAGSAGAPGVPGQQGAATFLAADAGEDGERGPPGPAGSAGSAGAPGTQGDPGQQGAATFLAADAGEDGERGPPGPAGSAGSAGSAGAQGQTGPAVFLAAEAGDDGERGPPGPAGSIGATGTPGAQGQLGAAVFLAAEAGDDGERGPPGPQGSQGIPGNDGAVGPQGSIGAALFMLAQDGEDGAPGMGGVPTPATALSVEISDATNAIGTGTALSLSDHVHAHGNRGGGTLHAAATTGVAGFLSAADKTRLDGLGIVPKRLTVAATGNADYTTIKAAVDTAMAGGVTLANPWHVIVSPGVYNENAFTMGPGVSVASTAGAAGGVIVIATDATNDLVTMNGGNLLGITLRGVTTAGKALIRSANPLALSALYYVGLQNCAIGWALSGGAPGAGNVVTCNITGAGLGVTETVIKVTTSASLSLLGAFFSAPSALLPAYATNPIQTAILVDGASADLSSISCNIAPKNGTQESVVADNGAFVSVLSSSFITGATALKIGSVGSNTRLVVNASRFSGHTTQLVSQSAAGVFNVSGSTDTLTTSLTAGTVLNGSVQQRSLGTLSLLGAVESDFSSGRAIGLDEALFEGLSSGVTVGGVVTAATGLTVDVASGSGFIARDSEVDVTDRTWAAETGLAVTASTTNFIYVDAASQAVTAGLASPGNGGLLLAIVVTTGSAVRYVHKVALPARHPQTLLQTYLLSTRKFALDSGLAVSQGTTNRNLTIAGGTYFRGLTNIAAAGGADVAWSYFFNAGAGEQTAQTLLSITQYDNAGTLTAMTAGYYRMDSVLITSDNKVSVIYGTAEYATQVAAEAALYAVVPAFLQESGFRLAKVVVQQGAGIASITDARPQPGSGASGGAGAGVSVHALLSGLGADDHTQYLLTTGARALTGNLDLGGFSVTNVNLVDGIDASAHAARHAPGGADAIALSASPADISDSTAAGGAANTFLRSDHVHAHGNRGGGSLHALVGSTSHGFYQQSNFSAVVDPTASNDNTQGYIPGSRWLNTVSRTEWVNTSNGTGTAVWKITTVSIPAQGQHLLFEGTSGEDGSPGPSGAPGIQGIQGAQGQLGAAVFLAADTGEDGERGPPGSQGVQGSTGPQGLQGIPGAALFMLAQDGEDGAMGPPGQGSGGGVTLPITAANVTIVPLGSPTYTELQKTHDLTRSAGHLNGGAITPSGTSVNVAVGQGFIRATSDDTSTLFTFDWPAPAALAIPTDTIRFVVAEYNAGTPQVVLYTGETYDYRTAFPLGFAVNEGGVLYINDTPHNVGRIAGRVARRNYEVDGRSRANALGGLVIGQTGTRNISVSSGVTWYRGTRDDFAGLDTNVSGSFDRYYVTAGVWTRVATQTQFQNSQYNDTTTGLQTLGNNNRVCEWFYLGPGGAIVSVLGRQNNSNLSTAIAEPPPASLPLRLQQGAILLGRTITIKNASSAELVQSAFGVTFSGSVPTAHGDLSGLTVGDDHTQYQLRTEKGAVSGYASLGLDGLVPPSQLPAQGAHLLVDGGEAGEQGPPGPAGAAGSSGTSGSNGPAVFLAAEPGDDGERGPPGAVGAVGAPGTTYVGSVKFDASADELSRVALPVVSTSFSAGGWFLYDASGGTDQLIAGSDAAGTGLHIATRLGVLVLTDTFGFVYRINTVSALVDQQWYYAGLQVNGTSAILYKGDERTPIQAFPGTILAQGASPTWNFSDVGGNIFAGRLARWRVWNALLTPAQFELERQSARPVRTSNLSADWWFESAADKVTDYSGNANHLVASGVGPWQTGQGPNLGIGNTGLTGAQGPATFLAADAGEDGERGPPGQAGSVGAQGQPGAALFFLAADGEDGSAGTPGAPGATGPQGAPGGGGGGVNGTATINFGAHPGANEATIVITGQAAITTANYVRAWVMSETSAGKTVNDHRYLARFAAFTTGAIVNGVGFTIYAASEHKLTGQWTLRWRYD